MKRILIVLSFLSVPVSAWAQQGIVTYEEKQTLEIELPPEMQHHAADFPNEQTSTRLLYFNESASLLKNAPQEETAAEQNFTSDDGMVIRIQRGGMDNMTYTNLDEGTQIEKREFMGRTFRITGEIESLPWKLTDERSEFLGYMSQKAVAERDSVMYEAWFTPEIAVPVGPEVGGLPGLILVLNIDDGNRTFVAKEVSLDTLEEGAITEPDKGKKVTRAEFDEIVEEKMKEMNMTRDGRGNVMVRITH